MTTTIGHHPRTRPSRATVVERLVLRTSQALAGWVDRRVERRGARIARTEPHVHAGIEQMAEHRRTAQATLRLGPFQG